MGRIVMLLVFFLYACSSAPRGKMERIRIAIMDLKPVGISEKDSITVSNMLRTEMINAERFIVLERAQMNEILKEQGLQMSGCIDDACSVKIGKMLSAKKILIGEAAEMGKSIILTVRIVDVEKSISEYAATQRSKSQDELYDAVLRLSRDLTAKISQLKSEEDIDTTGREIATRDTEKNASKGNYEKKVGKDKSFAHGDAESGSFDRDSSGDSANNDRASAYGKYENLLQKITCPGDESSWGKYYDYGHYPACTWCGVKAAAGFWVYVAPTWYIWQNEKQ